MRDREEALDDLKGVMIAIMWRLVQIVILAGIVTYVLHLGEWI